MFVIEVLHIHKLQTVQRHGVCSIGSIVNDAVHYKEPLESFDKSRHGFLLSRYCHNCAESNIHTHTHIYLIVSILPNVNNFHSLEVVDRFSKTTGI